MGPGYAFQENVKNLVEMEQEREREEGITVIRKDVVSCAVITRNALLFLHAITAGFQARWKIFMRQKCCSVCWNNVP